MLLLTVVCSIHRNEMKEIWLTDITWSNINDSISHAEQAGGNTILGRQNAGDVITTYISVGKTRWSHFHTCGEFSLQECRGLTILSQRHTFHEPIRRRRKRRVAVFRSLAATLVYTIRHRQFLPKRSPANPWRAILHKKFQRGKIEYWSQNSKNPRNR